jgi:hypothetical protein
MLPRIGYFVIRLWNFDQRSSGILPDVMQLNIVSVLGARRKPFLPHLTEGDLRQKDCYPEVGDRFL